MTEENAVISLLEEILLWMKYDFLETKRKLVSVLNSKDKILAYELSTGENSTHNIAEKVSVSAQTVSNWWKIWFEEGLMEQTEKYGGSRFKRLSSLSKLGIKIPEIFEEDVDER